MPDRLYTCTNDTCVLGQVGGAGVFTQGMTPEMLNTITGQPVEEIGTPENEGKTWGEGVCPNCGKPGELAKDESGNEIMMESVQGEDPYQELHDEVAQKVESDQITMEEAQEAFLAEVEAAPEEAPATAPAEEVASG